MSSQLDTIMGKTAERRKRCSRKMCNSKYSLEDCSAKSKKEFGGISQEVDIECSQGINGLLNHRWI